YHDRHDQLKLLAGSPAKAEFLSKCIYWWQISKYKIKNSEHIWFTRTTDELAAGAGLSESSVGRYLRDFATKGLIEKRTIKRYSKKHGQDIACLHIRITEKLLALLKTTTKKPSTANQETIGTEQPDSKNLSHTDDTPSVNLTVPTIYNKEKNLNNSTVKQVDVNCVEKKEPLSGKTVFSIEKQIGERVTTEVKEQVKGMLFNVLKQQNQSLKHHERLFSEVLFAITNQAQFKGVTCITHRINIAASLIRKKQWKTPKGFYNHWDIGQSFKERDEVKRRRMQQEKLQRELLGVTDPQLICEIKARLEVSQENNSYFDKPKTFSTNQKLKQQGQKQLTDKLNQINNEILSQGNYLKQMENAYQKGLSYASRELIDVIGIKLAKLYDEQALIESEIESMQQAWGVCA
ncbi:MAG: helix-turn-helix domain-containing protein, partial [Proteobacteria bacterium]|nr:helix-turn-helix domain-containing protein [Pseudomonadota bacterium]